jgi:hypothetical protein
MTVAAAMALAGELGASSNRSIAAARAPHGGKPTETRKNAAGVAAGSVWDLTLSSP